MNRIQKVLGSAAVTSLLLVAPLAASAATLDATGSTGVAISPSGIVRVIGADVTSVSNGFFDAVTAFGNTVMSWIVNVSAATKIGANGSANASTSDIKIGDKVSFTGSLGSSTGNVLTVAATKVLDLTTFPLRHIAEGKVSNINSANGTFTLTHDGRTVVVQTNASTTIMADGATTTFASLTAGEKVNVSGTPNVGGSVIVATRIIVQAPDEHAQKNNDNEDNDNDGDHGGRGDRNATTVNVHANVKADEHSHGGHGDLNFFGAFRLGKDD